GRLGTLVRSRRDRPPPLGRTHRRAFPDPAHAVALAQRAPFRPEAPGAAQGTPVSKYDPQAAGWTEEAYADAEAYLDHRADLVVSLGPRLEPGDRVLDLACGDGGFGQVLLERGLRYAGVDASEGMVAAARQRLGERAPVALADLNDFRPSEPVTATTIFRAIYYARDPRAFFAHVDLFTSKKLIFDLNRRQYSVEEVVADLRRVGFDRIDMQPFFVPQRVDLPKPFQMALLAAEHAGPFARLALRVRFTYI